jgi:hypothetical protein
MSSRRSIIEFHNFARLDVECRKDLYDRVAELVINVRTRTLGYMIAVDKVACAFHILITKLGRQTVETSICDRVHTRKLFLNAIDAFSSIKVELILLFSPLTANQNNLKHIISPDQHRVPSIYIFFE